MSKPDTGWQKDFMKMLNYIINDLKTKPEYKAAKEILNIDDNSEDVIDESMFDYSNDKRKDDKNENELISKTKKIGKNILKEVKGVSNHKILYNNLRQNKALKTFFDNNNIKASDIYEFGDHIAGFKTKSMENHEKQNAKRKAEKQALEQANETLKGENKEKTKKIESLKKETEQKMQQMQEQAEEDKRTIKAEANRDKNEKIAQIKHKMEERHEKDKEELLEEAQRNQKEIYGFAPNLEAYIKKKLASKAYSLDEDELIDKIARDIGKPGGLPKGTDPELVAKAIYDRGAEETIKHIKKIANLAILTGYNNDLYNKLPGDVAQEVQKYITDKINDDIRKKNIKYILPKDKPRWEYAMQTKNLNPMLGRSAWRVN